MGVKPIWDNPEKTVVRHMFEGRWTIGEIWYSAGEAWQMMHTVNHTVHAILDLRHGNAYPSGVLSVSNRIVVHRPTNAGIIILAGPGGFVRMLASAFRKTYGRLHPNFVFHVTDTLEEAREQIRKHEEKLRQPMPSSVLITPDNPR
jgi:hypothetical protein